MTVQRREKSSLISEAHSSPVLPSNGDNTRPPPNPLDSQENDIELMTKPLFDRPNSRSRESSSPNHTDDSFKAANIRKYKEEMWKRRISTGASRHVIDRLQGIYLSKKMSSYIPVSTSDSDGNGSGNSGIHPSGRIPLVRGIDRVINGTKPAAEVVVVCGIKPLRYFWYMLSGVICDCIQFVIDLCLNYLFHISDPSACWVIGFGLSIIFRHTFHRYLVFGAYVGGYWNSLVRMYTGYSIIIFISTMFNIVMTKRFHFSHYKAWIATLLWTGIVNYFILKHIWTFGGPPSSSDDSSVDASSKSGRKRSPMRRREVNIV